jgi:hypothetical protein
MGEKAKAGNNRFEVEAKRAKTRAQQGFESASEVKHSRPPPPSYIDAVKPDRENHDMKKLWKINSKK